MGHRPKWTSCKDKTVKLGSAINRCSSENSEIKFPATANDKIVLEFSMPCREVILLLCSQHSSSSGSACRPDTMLMLFWNSHNLRMRGQPSSPSIRVILFRWRNSSLRFGRSRFSIFVISYFLKKKWERLHQLILPVTWSQIHNVNRVFPKGAKLDSLLRPLSMTTFRTIDMWELDGCM